MSQSTLPTIAENKTETRTKDTTGPGRVTISRQLTTQIIPASIGQNFINVYNFMNQSLGIQKNKIIFYKKKLGVINFDFYEQKTNECLYCVIKQQNSNTNKLHQWYMIEKLFTKNQLQKQFNISKDQVPKSIRLDNSFKRQLNSITNVSLCKDMKNVIQNTNWNKITIHKRANNREVLKLFLTKSEFRNKLRKFSDNIQITKIKLLPILRVNNEKYWIEHIWIVEIRQNVCIGVALQMNTISNKLEVRGIYLDKMYIYNLHQLATPHNCVCLNDFVCTIDNLAIGNIHDDQNRIKNLKRENNKLKQIAINFQTFMQKLTPHLLNEFKNNDLMVEAMDLLSLIKDNKSNPGNAIEMGTKTPHVQNRYRSETSGTSLNALPILVPYTTNNLPSVSYPLIINTSSYYSTPLQYNTVPMCGNNLHSTSISQMIPTIICPRTQYQIFIPKNDTIYISKMFTEKWLSHVREAFVDCKIFYYYLANSVKLQTIDQFAKIYNDRLVIANVDIHHKISGDVLYGIIKQTNMKKFNWEMILLCDKKEIFQAYNIIENDLPISSRNVSNFKNQLYCKFQLKECDISNINIQSLNIIKNKSIKSLQSSKMTVQITNDGLKTYLIQSMINEIESIPIVKIKSNKYWIEHVIIVQIPRSTAMHIGVSFNCINNKNIATSIFLDKKDIYYQHVLTGLWMNCNHLNNFSSVINELICMNTKRSKSNQQ